MSDADEYDSGPYCEHWSDPEFCGECAMKKEIPQKVRDALEWAMVNGAFGGQHKAKIAEIMKLLEKTRK